VKSGVGVRVGRWVGVMVRVGVMVGAGARRVCVGASLTGGKSVAVGVGVLVEVGEAVVVGVGAGVKVALLGWLAEVDAAATVGRPAGVGVGVAGAVGVGLKTVGDAVEKATGVAVPAHPVSVFVISKAQQTANSQAFAPVRTLGFSSHLARALGCILGCGALWLETVICHLPRQKVPNIVSTRSSLAVSPVISPSALIAGIRSMATRSGESPA
jgi:hypothetical protein